MNVTIEWYDGKKTEYQEKRFKDEMKAIEFCRTNKDHIVSINYKTVPDFGHFSLMDALKGCDDR